MMLPSKFEGGKERKLNYDEKIWLCEEARVKSNRNSFNTALESLQQHWKGGKQNIAGSYVLLFKSKQLIC